MTYLIFLFINFFSLSPATEKVDLKVIVTNIKTHKGAIQIGIFNNSKSFLKEGKEYKGLTKTVKDDTVIFTFKDLDKGDYAVSLFHDVNSDQKCNLNFIGIPVEPYGFSKNFKPKLSKPSFNDCKITVNANSTTTIKLID